MPPAGIRNVAASTLFGPWRRGGSGDSEAGRQWQEADEMEDCKLQEGPNADKRQHARAEVHPQAPRKPALRAHREALLLHEL